MKFTLEEKKKLALLHINEGVPIHEIAKTYNFDVGRLKYNISLYQKWGDKAFDKSEQRRSYSRELKLQTIHEILSKNISYRQKGIELMLSDPTIISDWMKLYIKYGEEGIKDTNSREAYKHHEDKILEKEYKKLLEDLERTKAENAYLKKSYSLILKRSKQSKKR